MSSPNMEKLWRLYQKRTLEGSLPALEDIGIPVFDSGVSKGRFSGTQSQGDEEQEAKERANRLLSRVIELRMIDNEGNQEMSDYKIPTREAQLLEANMELHQAVRKFNLKRAKELIDAGAWVNMQDPVHFRTPMHFAVQWSNPKMMDLLLSTGECNLLIEDKRGRIPLDIAQMGGIIIRTEPYRARLNDLTIEQAEANGVSLEHFERRRAELLRDDPSTALESRFARLAENRSIRKRNTGEHTPPEPSDP